MNIYATTVQAISPIDGELKKYCGPNVPGISEQDARDYCENNGLGYCHIEGLLIAEIPCKEGTHDPDWSKMTDYENIRSN